MQVRRAEEGGMTDRAEKERVLRELYEARVAGDLDTISLHFAPDCRFEMAGSPGASAVAVKSVGAEQFQPLIAQLIKIFAMSDLKIVSMLIDGDRAAVHWRVRIKSSVTEDMAVTDLCDMIEFKDGRVVSFLEFCDTALAASMMARPGVPVKGLTPGGPSGQAMAAG
jgi:ketosteroid isomerase-like protein